MTALSSHVCSIDEDESERIILHERVVLRKRTNQKASSSTKIYRRAILRTRTDYVLRRETNYNALLRNKKSQIMRLHMMCRTILTPLTYSNAKESFWTELACHMKERVWPLQKKNTLRRCWII